ncbi:DUF1482 family protein [Lelliottia sp. V89_10]|uniref:DUF1482 family protein n=1 Tax=Lelliottia wanjuensis TaxID=3050585 RepID=UPI00249F87AD|nr:MULTISPECIES: DUF1482 family protein [unclassified Lelliottia]MDI3359738.1 DUF1482 family protein [Lelliottia sp. V89_13]MDK9548696.1 DUF1482 family protein [Lelliottia sp. V89_5]MDK9597328.1 DUF1482 family protein [Lelliottia sp. V89_10]
MIPLFALVLTICSSNSTDCTDVVKEVYDTQAQCEQVIYEERYFNANCYPVEKIIHAGELSTARN